MNGQLGHSEDPSNPWYTTDGAKHTGNCCAPVGGADAIDCWATAPYHATVMLQPGRQSFGLSTFEQSGKVVATMELGWDWAAMRTAKYPVLWPGPGSTVPYTRYWGGEVPDPMAGSGYTNPIGLPIVVMFAAEKSFSNSHLRCDGTELQHFLRRSGKSAFIIPRRPLERGKTYDVSITASGVAYRWSFTVGSRRTTDLSIVAREDADEGNTVLAVDLKSAGLPSAKQVKIERSTDGVSWQTSAWIRTSSISGSASTQAAAGSATYYRATFAGDELSAPATSDSILVGAEDTRAPTTLQIQPPGELSIGESVTLHPVLEAGGTAIVWESLHLQRSSDGATWTNYRTYAQADLSVTPIVMEAAGYYRLHYVGSAQLRPSSSAVWKVSAAVTPLVKNAHRVTLAKLTRSPVRVSRAVHCLGGADAPPHRTLADDQGAGISQRERRVGAQAHVHRQSLERFSGGSVAVLGDGVAAVGRKVETPRERVRGRRSHVGDLRRPIRDRLLRSLQDRGCAAADYREPR